MAVHYLVRKLFRQVCPLAAECGHDPHAGRRHLRLGVPVHRDAAAGPVGQHVVCAVRRAAVVKGTRRYYVRVVGRGVICRELSCTQIAGGHHNDDALEPGLLHRRRQRVAQVAVWNSRIQRDVDHPNVVAILVGDQPLERQDDVARASGAIAPGDLDAEEASPRRDAQVAALRVVASDDAGHPGAVAAAVLSGLLLAEVSGPHQPPAEVGLRVDAAVDHRHRDVIARDALLPRRDGVGGEGVDRRQTRGVYLIIASLRGHQGRV